VARGVANLVVLALVGCVGENPDWDRRTTEMSGSPTDGADTQADSSTESSSTDASESSGAPEGTSDGTSVGTSDGTSTEPTTGEGPSCAAPAQLCNGVCSEMWKDKHACGPECIDCTELHGNTAKCKEGVCDPPGGKDDD
jgi:hypothetical protein